MIKAVLFDFDGVLVDTFTYHFKAWQHFLAGFGVTVEPEQVFLNEGLPVQEIARNLVRDLGINISEEEILELARQKNQYFRDNNQAQFIDGMPELISDLKSKEIKVAMVTGTVKKNIQAVLSPAEIDLFDVIVKDGDTERGKPYGDPYIVGAKKLGVAPENCLVVENAPMGIDAARNAGIKCAALCTTLDAKFLKNADFIFKNVSELNAWFVNL